MSLGKKLPSVYTCTEGEQKAGVRSNFHFADPCQLLKNRELECCVKENLKSDLGRSVCPGESCPGGGWDRSPSKESICHLPSRL